MKALAKLEILVTELGDPWLVSRLLARQEAVSSSAIENTHSTLDELLALEEGEDGQDDGERLRAARQVRDYALALENLLPVASRDGVAMLTAQTVGLIHRSVMAGDADYKDIPGELRKKVVWIGSGGGLSQSTFNPPPPDDVEVCLADNLAFMRGDHDELAPSIITRLAVAHAHFEAVHPYTDGNGRVGRLLLPLMMAAEGAIPLYLSPYIEAHRTDYYEALKAAQQRLEWVEIIGFMSDAVVGTVSELVVTRAALAELQKLWLLRRRFRSGSAATRTLTLLPHYPVITVGRLASILRISWPQAAQAVDQLVSAGILVERTGYRRNRLFAAPEALTIINRPFGDEVVLPEKPCPENVPGRPSKP
jgi:Fic family protein